MLRLPTPPVPHVETMVPRTDTSATQDTLQTQTRSFLSFFFKRMVLFCFFNCGKISFVCCNTDLMPYNNRNLFSQSPGGQKPKIKGSQHCAPSRGPGEFVACLSQLLTCGFRTPISPSEVTLSPPPLISMRVIAFRAHPDDPGLSPYLESIRFITPAKGLCRFSKIK